MCVVCKLLRLSESRFKIPTRSHASKQTLNRLSVFWYKTKAIHPIFFIKRQICDLFRCLGPAPFVYRWYNIQCMFTCCCCFIHFGHVQTVVLLYASSRHPHPHDLNAYAYGICTYKCSPTIFILFLKCAFFVCLVLLVYCCCLVAHIASWTSFVMHNRLL
jgi:hypothetical protein